MSQTQIYDKIVSARAEHRKLFAVLIDPDKFDPAASKQMIINALEAKVDFFFIGGSLLVSNQLEECILAIKSMCNTPVILFPGSIHQISSEADAILLLSLISGRNPELLIGNHVIAAPNLKKSGLEILSTGYMLIDGGRPTTVSYISNTLPIPEDKPDIAACTAMAGEMLGMKLIFMDAGSGAQRCITEQMISEVRKYTNVPILTGGGIRTADQAAKLARAGADLIVVGNILETDPLLVRDIAAAIHQVQPTIA